MKTFAIGDVHGCFDALLAVVQLAEISAQDRVVWLGFAARKTTICPPALSWLTLPAGQECLRRLKPSGSWVRSSKIVTCLFGVNVSVLTMESTSLTTIGCYDLAHHNPHAYEHCT